MKIANNECCGCGLCAAICPRNCIVMQADPEGFLNPVVEESQCVHCDLCKKSCSVNKAETDGKIAEFPADKHCFYAISADDTMVAAASSGGIFPQLAVNVLKKGGAVAGAAFNENFDVVLTLTEDIKELHKLMQAKYVQAEVPVALFAQAVKILEAGRPLLFSGTPCQIAAFRSFCGGKQYPALICAEIICHGVPSPAVWRSYLHSIQDKVGTPLKSVAFRDKVCGWHKYSLTVSGSCGKVSQIHKESPYMQLFLNELISRKSCTACAFKNGKSHADLSLGDFWKLRKIAPELDNSTGASMVIVHTPQGRKALEECNLKVCKEFPMDVVKISNRAYAESIQPHHAREQYFTDFICKGQNWIGTEQYLKKGRKNNFLQRIFSFLHISGK